MMHLRAEIRIEAPVEHVWQLFCDVSHWKDWMPWGEYSDFSGPLDEAGTTFVGRMRLVGYEMKSLNEVVEIELQRLYHERSDFGSMDQYVHFEPDGDSTRVVFDADYEMRVGCRASSRTWWPRSGSNEACARCLMTSRPSPRPRLRRTPRAAQRDEWRIGGSGGPCRR